MNIYALQHLGMPQITTSMILQAMDSIVNKFETKRRKIMFILVSDNPIHIIQNDYLLRMKKKFNVYQIQNGLENNEISVGVDMAILSKCNFTILSYGTYSFWSGFLSGGPKILPYHMGQPIFHWDGNKPHKFQVISLVYYKMSPVRCLGISKILYILLF